MMSSRQSLGRSSMAFEGLTEADGMADTTRASTDGGREDRIKIRTCEEDDERIEVVMDLRQGSF